MTRCTRNALLSQIGEDLKILTTMTALSWVTSAAAQAPASCTAARATLSFLGDNKGDLGEEYISKGQGRVSNSIKNSGPNPSIKDEEDHPEISSTGRRPGHLGEQIGKENASLCRVRETPSQRRKQIRVKLLVDLQRGGGSGSQRRRLKRHRGQRRGEPTAGGCQSHRAGSGG